MAGISDYRNFQSRGFSTFDYGGVGIGGSDANNQPPDDFVLHHGPTRNRDAYNNPFGYFEPGNSGAGDHNLSPRSINLSTPPISSPDSLDDPNIKNYTARGVGLLGVIMENLLRHPFIGLRRQCQVHVMSTRYHLFPVTLISPMFQICQRQGVGVMWKGLGSSLLVKGMGLAAEDVTSKALSWPKEVNRHSTLKAFVQHIFLKSLSVVVITPFYSASLVETVQSEVASETAGFFDVFREGLWRLLAWPSTGRLVPLHVLIVPTVAHGILFYLIYTGIKSVSLSTIKRVRESKERKQGALSKDTSVSYYMEMTASLIGSMVADILLFPLETILHRLHLQGTRTIIDNLDSGIEVTPILTSYGGVVDCIRTTIDEEGFSGLYKGFGALVLQYGLQILLIRTVKIVLERTPFGQNGNNAVTKSLSPLPGPNAIASSVHQSRSEPTNINMHRTYDAHSRRTPTDLREYSASGSSEVDARASPSEPRLKSRFTGFSPTAMDRN